MALGTRKGEGRGYDLEKIFEFIGWENVLDGAIKKWGVEKFVDAVGVEKVIEKVGVERVMDALCKNKAMLAQLKRRLAREDR